MTHRYLAFSAPTAFALVIPQEEFRQLLSGKVAHLGLLLDELAGHMATAEAEVPAYEKALDEQTLREIDRRSTRAEVPQAVERFRDRVTLGPDPRVFLRSLGDLKHRLENRKRWMEFRLKSLAPSEQPYRVETEDDLRDVEGLLCREWLIIQEGPNALGGPRISTDS